MFTFGLYMSAITEYISFPNESGDIKESLQYTLKLLKARDVKILDIGCNYGSLIYNLYKQGYRDVHGVDLRANSIAAGQKKYKEISQNLNTYDGISLPFEDNFFDVILMFDVIEHIPNVKDYLRDQVFRVLKPGGIFIFQTPNIITNIPWEIIDKKSLIKWRAYHISLQTVFSLRNILKRAGLNGIVIEKHNVLSTYKITKVKRKLGLFGVFMLHIMNRLPLVIYTNFWGHCHKPNK